MINAQTSKTEEPTIWKITLGMLVKYVYDSEENFVARSHPHKALKLQIENSTDLVLSRYLPEILLKALKSKGIINGINKKILRDLLCFAQKDPAAKNNPQYILESYLSFKAVYYYRIAHTLYTVSPGVDTARPLQIVARKISEEAKVKTGVEIHPGAKIGSRFVIDHGLGTVIGETTVIGNDCYILQGVTLGATGIASNQNSKRHPTLGNRVEVGGFVRIFGSVTIGDDVKISPCVVITQDIPANSKVILKTTNQIIRTKSQE